MTIQIIMPALGESVHEGTIGKWLKQPGEKFERFEAICEVITDKVNAEIPSESAGSITKILVQEGETVAVGTVLAEMEPAGATATTAAPKTEEVGAKKAEVATSAAFAATPAPSFSSNGASDDYSNVTFPSGRAVVHDDDEDSLDFSASRPAGLKKNEVVATNATKDLIGDSSATKKPNRYSPAVRRLAEEHNLNLDVISLQGSGLGGRITRDDVMSYIENHRTATPVTPVSQPQLIVPPVPQVAPPMHDQIAANAMRVETTKSAIPAPVAQPQPVTTDNRSFSEIGLANTPQTNGDYFVPLTPMRRAIAEHMVRSKQTSPHAWTIVEVDMTKLVKYRAKIKESFKQQEGVDLTYLPFVIQAVTNALKQFPQVNASWAAEGNGVIIKRDINIGVAVDVPDGLIVPVIQHADEKNLVGLARNLNDLVTRARNKKLTVNDVQGGTFTVNNPGAFGSVMSYPIINQPQTGIVTMEAIVKRPVVVTDSEGNETIAIRSMMNMCLSFDHRVIDGAMAGRFLQAIKKQLETLDGLQQYK